MIKLDLSTYGTYNKHTITPSILHPYYIYLFSAVINHVIELHRAAANHIKTYFVKLARYSNKCRLN